jgi:hypothetical protein
MFSARGEELTAFRKGGRAERAIALDQVAAIAMVRVR